MIKKIVLTLIYFYFLISTGIAQIIPNGMIDNIDELSLRKTVYIPAQDGTMMATDISIPVFRDSVVVDVEFFGNIFPVQIIPKNSQYIIYDTISTGPERYRLPIIFTRTPYNKQSDVVGSQIIPFLGYTYAIQDMRGRYESEGVYFPMYSDAWPKVSYHPNITIPMDLTPAASPHNALYHQDGSDALYYIANNLFRIEDVNLDGTIDTVLYCNGSIGMFGASALGNSQYQALSNIPFSDINNPVKFLMPIVATNEHYNTTLFHNGVYRNSLASGWIKNQMTNGIYNHLVGVDTCIHNNLHSPADYGYTNNQELADDMIDWLVVNDLLVSPSGAHPSSLLRSDLDASMAPVDALGYSDLNGTHSRYKNLNKPIYHLTGWWDIFINGQIETFNNVRNSNPGSNQKLIIGPWTHQTIGNNKVGDVIYPQNVFDVLNINFDIDPNDFSHDSLLLNKIYSSEILLWFRTNLGGEPFFIVQESHNWQSIGAGNVRVPSSDYIIPYYKFLNFLGGLAPLSNFPVEIDTNGIIISTSYNIPTLTNGVIKLSSPLTAAPLSYFDNVKDVRIYITGPTDDPANIDVGNFWLATDSLPFNKGVNWQNFYLHHDLSVDLSAPQNNQGSLSYTADPYNPVITIGGNNMIPNVPNGNKKSQGSMDLANPLYIDYTMNRSDVLAFTTPPLTDTMTVVGFPKAALYAKGNASTYTSSETDFDLMVRVLDVYPDGREMLITEGVVNAKAREYAKSIFNGDTNNATLLTNIANDTYYYFNFDLLPLGHTFGVGHKIKFLISSSNFPKYQSNPHVPNRPNEFFRWNLGDTSSYSYQGMLLKPQNSIISLDFNTTYPNFISLPKIDSLPNTQINKSNKISTATIVVYPNPSCGVFNIVSENLTLGTIEVYNIMGQLVSVNNDFRDLKHATIDLSNLTNGIYFLKSSHSNQIQKLVIN